MHGLQLWAMPIYRDKTVRDIKFLKTPLSYNGALNKTCILFLTILIKINPRINTRYVNNDYEPGP
jgi:hypothetical protein